MNNAQPVRIRRAAPDDAGAVMTLVGELAAHQGQSAHLAVTTERWRDLLARDDVVVLIAELGELDNMAIGYVSAVRRLHLWSGHDILALDDVYVRGDARNGGVGRALMSELARLVAPDRLTITWGVEPDNEAAQRFYARLGATLRRKVLASWPPEAYGEQSAGLARHNA